MVTYDKEDKGVLQDLASLLGNNSKKWDLLDHSKKNMWMISTLALLPLASPPLYSHRW